MVQAQVDNRKRAPSPRSCVHFYLHLFPNKVQLLAERRAAWIIEWVDTRGLHILLLKSSQSKITSVAFSHNQIHH